MCEKTDRSVANLQDILKPPSFNC